MQTLNPTTGRPIKEYAFFTPEQVEERVQQAQKAFYSWSQTTFDERATLMERLASHLRKRVGEYATLITTEMGKPLTQARTEVLKCADGCDFFAERAEHFLQEERIDPRTILRFEPLGVILGIMPWNYPFWQVFRFIAPTLMAGNAVLIKHASNVTGCSLAIEAALSEVGFPSGLCSALIIESERASQLIAHPGIAGATLTGSERAGAAVGQAAGKALKKSVLELGGSDPFLVLPDADLDLCIPAALKARLSNCGQSCIAAKRFFIAEQHFERFCQALLAQVERLKIGDPLLEGTDVGPLARKDLLETVERQVNESVAQGASLLYGGHRLPREGFFYTPAILTKAAPGMPILEQETFGPIFVLMPFKSVEEAISLANRSPFGLGASVWTRDLSLGKEVAQRLQAGMVYVNAPIYSTFELPFGGIKRSGYGRELSHYGIKEFVNIKAVRLS